MFKTLYLSVVYYVQNNPSQVHMPVGEDDAQGSGDHDEEGSNENNDRCNEKTFLDSKLLEGAKPLALRWPETWRERFVYIFLLPFILPLWLTLPDAAARSVKMDILGFSELLCLHT